MAFQALVVISRKMFVNACSATVPRIWEEKQDYVSAVFYHEPSRCSRSSDTFMVQNNPIHTVRRSHLHLLCNLHTITNGNYLDMSPFRGEKARPECNI